MRISDWSSDVCSSDLKIPSDLFVFPNEEHVKWQPTHRLAVYRRNLAWFDFWLKDQSPSDPIGSLEVARWAKMKKAWKEVSSLNKSIDRKSTRMNSSH